MSAAACCTGCLWLIYLQLLLRQSLRIFCASKENQPRKVFRAPGIATLTMLSSPSEERVFICAACWEMLCILSLPISTDEVVIIITAYARIRLTKLEDRVPLLTI